MTDGQSWLVERNAERYRDAPPYMAQTPFTLMVNSPGQRYVELAGGTYPIIMEKNRLKLFEGVQSFLDEGRKDNGRR